MSLALTHLIGFGAGSTGYATAYTFGTFGAASAGGRTIDTGASGKHVGFQFTASDTGEIDYIKINFVSVSTGDNYHAELWTNSAGSPGTQIGSNSDTVAAGAGNKTFTFATRPSITAGTVYWLVLESENNTISASVDTCANDASYGSGRNNTITSLTNSLPSSEDWRAEVGAYR